MAPEHGWVESVTTDEVLRAINDIERILVRGGVTFAELRRLIGDLKEGGEQARWQAVQSVRDLLKNSPDR